jgi:hypothetical protein
MAFESEKTMFEIYRETTYSGQFRIVYYTELQDHNKEAEINRAIAGEHFLDGFIKDYRKEEAKAILEAMVDRMNRGEPLKPEDVVAALGEHSA